jgi:YidC/Oxa1 family membrane protein insertase
MDNFRLILIVGWFFILLLLYQAWQVDYGPKPSITSTPTAATDIPTPSSAVDLLPNTDEVANNSTMSALPELPVTQVQRLVPTHTRIHVETDVFKIEIDTVGGDLRHVELIKFPIAIDQLDKPFHLMDDTLPNFFIAQSGLLPKEIAPTHQAIYQTANTDYRMAQDANELAVTLTWQNEHVNINKIYTFHRDSYIIDVKYIVQNNAEQAWKGHLYGQLQRTPDTKSGNSFIYTYTGAALASPDNLYEKITFDNIKDGKLEHEKREDWKGGWAAMLQHYFVVAWIPNKDKAFKYYSNFIPDGTRYVIGMYGPEQTVAPHSQESFDFSLYVGPKVQDKLAELSPGLDLTVDYGWLWFIAQPLFWGLEAIHDLVKNWGWSIVILTILIKLAFFQLSATSYRSMANMRRLQPRLVQLKERFGSDKARLNQAMLEMYKKEKVNPLGGCLPILVQIPVFIALYWVLLESVELRQASFILWLNDLSTPDPYFILPLIMGATMLLQHRLNPMPIDPVQQKVMLILPFVFTVFFAFFPSGLVLYWVVNNILSIAQQWVITKKIAGDI